MKDEKEWFTPQQAVNEKLVPFSYHALLRKIKAGKIKALKEEGLYYLTREMIDEYLKKNIK